MGTPILTIYDENGNPYAIPAIRGEKGEKGESVLGVGETTIDVSTLEPGSNATAQLTTDGEINSKNFHFNFGIPRGDTGAKGDKGDKGNAGTNGITPNIGGNGNWWIGDVDTGVIAVHKSIVFGSFAGTDTNSTTFTCNGRIRFLWLYSMWDTDSALTYHAYSHTTLLIFDRVAYEMYPNTSVGYSSMNKCFTYNYDENTNISTLTYTDGETDSEHYFRAGYTYLYLAICE